MGKLYSIRYNNTQYTFIETLEFNNKQLLHFASSNNDSILFGYINNQLIKIDDEIKEKILEKYYPIITMFFLVLKIF